MVVLLMSPDNAETVLFVQLVHLYLNVLFDGQHFHFPLVNEKHPVVDVPLLTDHVSSEEIQNLQFGDQETQEIVVAGYKYVILLRERKQSVSFFLDVTV